MVLCSKGRQMYQPLRQSDDVVDDGSGARIVAAVAAIYEDARINAL